MQSYCLCRVWKCCLICSFSAFHISFASWSYFCIFGNIHLTFKFYRCTFKRKEYVTALKQICLLLLKLPKHTFWHSEHYQGRLWLWGIAWSTNSRAGGFIPNSPSGRLKCPRESKLQTPMLVKPFECMDENPTIGALSTNSHKIITRAILSCGAPDLWPEDRRFGSKPAPPTPHYSKYPCARHRR